MAAVYTQVGEERVVDYIDGTATPGTHQITAGTGAGTFVKGSTTLFTEVGEARVNATKSQPAADKNQWQATQTYTVATPKTITNAGVFSEATAVLIIGVDGLSVLVATNDSIQYTITLEQT